MGSYIEINDTLQLTTEQGFPSNLLNRSNHIKNPIHVDHLNGKIFRFSKKSSARIFQLDPVRVFLVHNTSGKWLFWGHALIQSIHIEKMFNGNGDWQEGNWITSGSFIIEKIYDPEYQKFFTISEAKKGSNYFDDN